MNTKIVTCPKGFAESKTQIEIKSGGTRSLLLQGHSSVLDMSWVDLYFWLA